MDGEAEQSLYIKHKKRNRRAAVEVAVSVGPASSLHAKPDGYIQAEWSTVAR